MAHQHTGTHHHHLAVFALQNSVLLKGPAKKLEAEKSEWIPDSGSPVDTFPFKSGRKT